MPRALTAALLVIAACGVSAPSLAHAQPGQASWFKVTSAATIQSTIDACIAAGGGVVYFPPGVYLLGEGSNAIQLRPHRKSASPRTPGLTLLGDGSDVSIVRATVSDTILAIMRDNVTIQGLTFECPDTAGAVAPGIVLGDASDNGAPPTAQHVVSHLRMRDCIVRGTSGPALVALPYPDLSMQSEFTHCTFRRNFSDTLVKIGFGSTTFTFDQCEFAYFPVTAVSVRGADGIHFRDCVFEHEQGDNGPFFYADQSVSCSVSGGWFEDDIDGAGVGLAAHQWFVHLDRSCHSFTLEGCTFRRGGTDVASQNPRALKVSGATGGPSRLRDESTGIVVLNPELLSRAGLSTSASYIQITSDSSDVKLIGGFARQSGTRVSRPVRMSPKRSGVRR